MNAAKNIKVALVAFAAALAVTLAARAKPPSRGDIDQLACSALASRAIAQGPLASANRRTAVTKALNCRPRSVSRYSTRGGRASMTFRSRTPADSSSASRLESVAGGTAPST